MVRASELGEGCREEGGDVGMQCTKWSKNRARRKRRVAARTRGTVRLVGAPLLSATDLRLDEGASVVVEGLTFATRGDKVLAFGASRPILRAAMRELPLRRGALLLDGHAPEHAARTSSVAIAPLDPPLPPELTPKSYVAWSARLATPDTGLARQRATAALAALGLEAVADLPLARCVLTARRATVVAAALATGAPALLFADPTAGLTDSDARGFARTLVKAIDNVRWVLFAPRLALESPLALAADEALVLGAGEVLAQGPPGDVAARERRFSLVVHGDAQAFAEALTACGFAASGAPPRLFVELSAEQGTRDLFALALAHGAVIVELSPVAGALA